MAMLPKGVHEQAAFNFELLRVADWKRECAKSREKIQKRMDTNTHSHTLITDHTKWSLQRSLMQVALSIFSPTSARGKNKRHLIPLWSHWKLPSPCQPVQQPAKRNSWCLHHGQEDTVPHHQQPWKCWGAAAFWRHNTMWVGSALWRCACPAEALPSCTSYPLLP